MNRLLELLQSVTSWAVDLCMLLGAGSAEAGFVIVSAVTGVVLVALYGKISSQSALAEVKGRIKAALLESIVFRHEPLQCLRAQGSLAAYGAKYFALAVPPILILALPCIFVLAQLQIRFGYASPAAGESLIVEAKVAKAEALNNLTLELPPSLVAVGPVRSPSTNEAFFRVNAKESGSYTAALVSGDSRVELPLTFGADAARYEAKMFQSWAWSLLYPSRALQNSPLTELQTLYPERNLRILGLSAHWMVHFFLISLVAGLIGSRIFGVEL